MTTARLHDDSLIEVTVLGDGPAVLLPADLAVHEGPGADLTRAWGSDPDNGLNLATGLREAGFRVVAADYEGHLAAHPKPDTLTAATVAADLLAVADAAGADRFAYYGYSWLALSGLQLALRTDRLTALAMGGYPPRGGPYAAMLTVTAAAHRQAVANAAHPPPAVPARAGDWESGEVTVDPARTRQFLSLYESLRTFDDTTVRLGIARLAFAGAEDVITYGPAWDDAVVAIAPPLREHRAALQAEGWTVELIPGADHVKAMQAPAVLPILVPWLRTAV